MQKRPFSNFWGDPLIGNSTKIGDYVEIGSTPEYPTTIGEGCRIQAFVYICPGTVIGDYVFIGPRVTFLNDKYPPSFGRHWAGVIVKKGASIGGGAILLPGITIGENARIGAGAVVTRDVPAGETWVGNPAHKLEP